MHAGDPLDQASQPQGAQIVSQLSCSVVIGQPPARQRHRFVEFAVSQKARKDRVKADRRQTVVLRSPPEQGYPQVGSRAVGEGGLR